MKPVALTWTCEQLRSDKVAQTVKLVLVNTNGVLRSYDVVQLADEGSQGEGGHYLQQVITDLGDADQQQALQHRAGSLSMLVTVISGHYRYW